MINNYPIHIEPGKGRYVFIFVLNERAVGIVPVKSTMYVSKEECPYSIICVHYVVKHDILIFRF